MADPAHHPSITALLPAGPRSLAWPLHDAAQSRALEHDALSHHAPQALMQRAGLAVARLAAAVAPHGRRVWVAAGPGNNGGDALVAALHLHRWGREVSVSLLADPAALPDDARHAHAQACAAGVAISATLPEQVAADLCLDGLLGLGTRRPASGAIARAIGLLNTGSATVLAIDLPSGLTADTGQALGDLAVRAAHTLSLLSLKPGLFTADGRDHAGRVWLDTLGVDPGVLPPRAWLAGSPAPAVRRHAQHKGSFGDVVVLGGADGMGGAAVLAARAALAAGAGRVFLARLGGDAMAIDALRPECMPRQTGQVLQPDVLARSTVVCGCGGGQAVLAVLPPVLALAGRLVLDADALNALAEQPALWPALAARTGPTVLTPHPLEAARLLGLQTAEVQADRLAAAQRLADRSRATVVLKGSGTVVASPGRTPVLNPTGHARLGSAGSGDVLAGWLGGWLACGAAPPAPGLALGSAADAAFDAACATTWWHGLAGEHGDPRQALLASDLVGAMLACIAATAAG
jgi:ADP-dependent NAD(P)H-hydrate dehydratase / NAD(P)H-hydrate epimerase